MQATLNREQIGAYVRQTAIELLEGAAPAGYDPRQAVWQGAGAERHASHQQDPRELMSRADIFHLLD